MDAEQGQSLRHVTGAWSEVWQQRHAATGWHPDPRIADLTAPD
jgi:hypothetical protein